MALLVDIGNSRIKWARNAGGVLLEHGFAGYETSDIPGALGAAWSALSAPARVLGCCVGGAEVRASVSAWTTGRWGRGVEWLTPRARGWGVVNAYPEPETLGADRWAALIAAHRSIAGAVCIVDCGTAITIDALEANGRHLGGLIMPGIGLMRRSLTANTGQIRSVTPGPVELLGRNTGDAVAAGTAYGAAALIERVLAEAAPDAECVVTGGDAPVVAPLLRCEVTSIPDLVLQGLAVAAEGGRE